VVIATERLDLHPFTVELASAIVAGDAAGRHWIEGFPREDDQDAAGMFLKLPGDTYCSYTIVDRGSGQTVGTIGFYGPPDERGAVMVGYGLAEAARGYGYATEALRGLMAFAFAQPEVTRILADADLDNFASHRVLEKAGFTRVTPGQWVHERG